MKDMIQDEHKRPLGKRPNRQIDKPKQRNIKDNRFPPSIFFVSLGVLLLMSGIHTGLIIGINTLGWSDLAQTIIPILYWSIVAAGLTLFIRGKIRKTYETPMHELADATRKVADGDFSVYIPPLHTADKLDYLDVMLIDFNKMVEELGSIETLKTDFFSNVSHEFKTPISVIYSNAQLLQKEGNLNENQKEYVNNIIHSSKRMSNLIYNMLKLNKLEKQAIAPVAEVYDVCAQLCECAVQFEDQWEEKQIEFEADLQDCAYVCADAELMTLVWNNLLSNAIKFTDIGGTVTLTQTSNEKEVRISVEDTGCGMSEDVLKHIFDKFYQGDTSHATFGNGLGLALVKRIIELSNATITVESKPGKGSVFTVIFPVAKAETGGEN